MPRAEGTAPAAARPCIPRATKKRYLEYVNIILIREEIEIVSMEMDQEARDGGMRDRKEGMVRDLFVAIPAMILHIAARVYEDKRMIFLP